jgi:hypothetical protein
MRMVRMRSRPPLRGQGKPSRRDCGMHVGGANGTHSGAALVVRARDDWLRQAEGRLAVRIGSLWLQQAPTGRTIGRT